MQSTQINSLKIIAALCPYADGPAVYTARAILRGMDTHRQEYRNECEKVYTYSTSSRLQNEEDRNKTTDLTSHKCNISPNPAQTKITLTHDGNFQRMIITEISGKVLYESNLNTSTTIQEINISDLANGVYIVNLIAENKTERVKLVINK